jgi:hypothetical protein
MNYDVIGDIHGQARKLEAMLQKLGYACKRGTWVPPEDHQAVFVGDLIDRGPEQARTVDIVRRMIDAGNAHCVMGNHEFNAIAYATPRQGRPGEFLRKRSEKNIRQHARFLQQVGEGSALHKELLHWFRTLPPALDLGAIRVVHAWWNDEYVSRVGKRLGRVPLDDQFMHAACEKGSPEWEAMEGLVKGMEIALPDGASFTDHEGVERREARARWWLESARTYRDYAFVYGDQWKSVPDDPLPSQIRFRSSPGSPVFVGHYWMEGAPRLESTRVTCVDYSAAREGFPLVCYRWQGEADLTTAHFIEVL